MTERLTTLDTLEAEIWRELEKAPGDKHHAWRSPVLATVVGDSADARTVILREVDRANKRLVTFTDARAAKVAQLVERPQATFVMWSPSLAWQLRCRVKLSVETGGLATTSRWARIKTSPAAQDYLSRSAPGAILESPDNLDTEPLERAHFAVVSAEVEAIDWLEIHHDGHRRAVFDKSGGLWIQA